MPISTRRRKLDELWEQTKSLLASRYLAWLIIALGALLRLAWYRFNPSLYVDEAALALNFINRSFAGLFAPLDSNQGAPVGFLILERLAYLTLGDSEYSLRLVPLLFSILSLFLFYRVAKRCLSNWSTPIALLLFASGSHLIYFSSQIKQYSSDVAIALAILLLGLDLGKKELTAGRTLILATLGALVVWLSHPSVFVLAGVGATLAVEALRNKQKTRFWRLAAAGAVWLASFAAFYALSLRNLSGNETLEGSWMRKGTFMPLLPVSLADLKWFPVTFLNLFTNPLGLPFPWVAGLLCIAGCVGLFLASRTKLFLLISPILFTLLASGLHKYPFGRRLLLFIAPLLFILISAGAAYIIDKKPPVSVFLGSALLALVLVRPVGGATRNMISPRAHQDMRPAMAYIRDHRQPGELIYVYHHQQEAFQYYAPKYGIGDSEYLMGKDGRPEWKHGVNPSYLSQMDALRGKGRVWFLFSHVFEGKGHNDEDYFISHLDSIGKRLEQFREKKGSAYLYELP